MAYVLDPSASQESFVTKLETEYPHIPVLPDGLLDTEEGIERFPDQSIKPFIIIWFSTPRRNRRGRSFVATKLDGYTAGADVVVVARSGTEARLLLNNIGNRLLDWKPANSGIVTEGSDLWRDSRAILDANNRPTRFAATRRFEWGIQANHVV